MEITYEEIISDIKKRIFKPVYFLAGEEPYYIDLITDYIELNILPESEKQALTEIKPLVGPAVNQNLAGAPTRSRVGFASLVRTAAKYPPSITRIRPLGVSSRSTSPAAP